MLKADMKRLAFILVWLWAGMAWAQVPPRVMDDLLIAASLPKAGEMETGWDETQLYFANVTTSNDAPFTIAFVGTGTRTIYWGDGQETTTNGNVTVTHTYASPGSNVFSFKEVSGATTRFYFYNLNGYKQLKRMLYFGTNGWSGLTSLQDTFRDCTGVVGSIPPLAAYTNITSLSSTWYGCSGITGSIPDISPLKSLNTLPNAWNGCSGLTGSIPDISQLNLLSAMNNTFYICSGLTGTLPNISELTNLMTLAFAWLGCSGLTGSIPDMSKLTKLTTIAGTFSGMTGLTGNIPNLSTLTNLTTIAGAFQNVRLTMNTNTVADILGLLSRTNLTTANQCFSVSSGLYASLVGNAQDFIALEKAANFSVGTASTNSSYRMFYNQTNLTDYATIDAAWK